MIATGNWLISEGKNKRDVFEEDDNDADDKITKTQARPNAYDYYVFHFAGEKKGDSNWFRINSNAELAKDMRFFFQSAINNQNESYHALVVALMWAKISGREVETSLMVERGGVKFLSRWLDSVFKADGRFEELVDQRNEPYGAINARCDYLFLGLVRNEIPARIKLDRYEFSAGVPEDVYWFHFKEENDKGVLFTIRSDAPLAIALRKLYQPQIDTSDIFMYLLYTYIGGGKLDIKEGDLAHKENSQLAEVFQLENEFEETSFAYYGVVKATTDHFVIGLVNENALFEF